MRGGREGDFNCFPVSKLVREIDDNLMRSSSKDSCCGGTNLSNIKNETNTPKQVIFFFVDSLSFALNKTQRNTIEHSLFFSLSFNKFLVIT